MPQQDGRQDARVNPPGGDITGLYVNPAASRRAGFQAVCADRFARLLLADGAQAALALLEREPVGLLVIDLEHVDPELDGAWLARLVAARAGAPVLVLCPFANARWLGLLMRSGPLHYAIAPLDDAALRAEVTDAIASAAAAERPSVLPGPAGREALELGALRGRVLALLGEGEDLEAFGEGLCRALCAWPGVVHAALFCLQPGGNLRLQAQHGLRNLNLARVLGRGDHLLQSPLRHAFPGLVAAAGDSIALLDRLEKADEPEMAEALRAHGVAMVLGVPLRSHGPGTPRGAFCLLFDSASSLTRGQFEALGELAELAALGLRLVDMNRESEEMLARVTQLSTLDALTGVANRRHGEALLEAEIKRARRYHLPLALVAFDIDRFREVNERYGNPVGDIALRSVAEASGALLRASDILVRSGGEEFLVIATHTSAIDGLKLAEKLRAAIEATVIPGADRVTISLGVAQLGEQESGDSLTLRANAALARAKRAGRNCVELAMG